MKDILSVKHLSKYYGDFCAVDDISFTVEEGSITALLGGNGAGKTTTISMILGLTNPTKGEVNALGFNMEQDRYKAIPFMNFSSPYCEMPYRLTVLENLTVSAHLYNLRDFKSWMDELMHDLDLYELRNRKAGELSAGQKTRLALAKSLLNKPRLLLLDEPTASIDPDTGDRLRQYLFNYKEKTGASILFSSHNMSEVERLSDHIILMHKGRIVDEGKASHLTTKYARNNMEEVFLHIARSHTLEDIRG